MAVLRSDFSFAHLFAKPNRLRNTLPPTYLHYSLQFTESDLVRISKTGNIIMTLDLTVVLSLWCLAVASAPEDAINVNFSLNDFQNAHERNTVEPLDHIQIDEGMGREDVQMQEETDAEVADDEAELEALLADTEEGTQITDSPEVNRCCTREKKIESIGFGVNGDVHYVDVGHCRRTCKVPRLAHGHIHKEKETTSSRSCTPGYHCEPAYLRQETHHLLSGPVTMTIISSCSCSPRKVQCQRLSQRLTLFPDSPYETDVDVGMCRGKCTHGVESCRPSRNRTVSVDGPNGAVCISIIDECACKTPCYRMHNTEVYYDWTWNESANSTQQTIKEIDVGVCVGACAPGGLHRCLLRDPNNSSICKMALNQRPASCGPRSFQTHRLTNAHGLERVVLAITECACM